MSCTTVTQQALRPPICDMQRYSESQMDRVTDAEILLSGHAFMTSPPMMIDLNIYC